MEHLVKVALIGLVSGIAGTGTGGLAALFITKINNRFLGLILEFSAGLMLSVVCFKLLPEAFELGGTLLTLAGVLIGIVTVMGLENMIRNSRWLAKSSNKGLLKAGVLMAAAIALHNLPEGFAVGSGFEASPSVGLTITAVIMIHDIPEGIAIAVPMRAGGVTGWKSFGMAVLSGVPMGLGAFLGAAIGGISQNLIALCLGFAGGAMLYIVCCELIPESKRLYMGRLGSLGNIAGILCGILVSVLN